jgi:peptide/nickel transport system substrate-binding protein
LARRFLLGLILILLQSPVTAGAAAPAKTGGTLRFGLSIDIADLNPFQRTLFVNKDVGSLAFECLLTADKNGEIRPSMATSWETSKDGLQYTFKLRKGVRFHDGREMTAEDVIWSMQYAMDPKNGAYGRDKLLSVSSLSASDPLTLHVTLKEPYVSFLATLTSFQAFPIVPKGSLRGGKERPAIYPPGTGPFMMTEYKSQQTIAFRRFNHYWQKGIPHLDGIQFRPIEDDTVRLTAVRTGEVDVADRVAYDQALRIQKGEMKDIRLHLADASGYRWIGFNTEIPPFNNTKLRQAVAFAIDKANIIDAITWGFGTVTNQKVLKGSRWWVPFQDRKRDVERARALLREAGHPNGIKVRGLVRRGWLNQDEMQLVQSQLREVDIHVDIEIVEFATHQNALRDGHFIFTVTGGLPYMDPDLAYYQYYHTENGAIKIGNYPRYSNPKVDRLLEQGRMEPDFLKRYRIYKEFLEMAHEEVPQIPLGFAPYVFAVRSRVRGFDVYPNGQFSYGVGGLAMTWLEHG